MYYNLKKLVGFYWGATIFRPWGQPKVLSLPVALFRPLISTLIRLYFFIYTSLFRQPAAQANKKKINSQ